MKFSKELLKGAAEIIVLQVLEECGEAYGYQLIKSIRTMSDSVFDFQEGTLYPLLYRLEQKKYLTSEEKSTPPSGKIRRYYSLTNAGRKVLRSRAKEIGFFLDSLKQVLHLA